MKTLRRILSLLMLSGLIASSLLHADNFALHSLVLNAGGGKQFDAAQDNSLVALDVEWWAWERSPRQTLSIGSSVAQWRTNAGPGARVVNVVSIYPQLTLYYPESFTLGQAFFQVRALGPSWISENSLGYRQQSRHFAFNARLAAGIVTPNDWIISLSYQHISNAGWSRTNDGWDSPINLAIGRRF